ncbi:cell wall synthesis protein CwsA [Mycobacterium sp. ITM-2016-00318]|uniref:cell wall synthesis protein CwsA n=1 Tax=Mycobacterium sp. ITM-2016-00318 TaxID=2099693 RepID=UPI000CF9D40B|nr:cell wall synthesis protein CwsA [Mycobacterium sp. ITM-2016-00318]WNG92938.1 cell wall synthesis protein CwsA [Mycobacterium sp. ITM-2016-00318]
MSVKTDARLSPGQRLSRGLKYTAVGPVDVTRGTVGLSVAGAQSAAAGLRRRIEKSRLAKELVQELEEAQGTIAAELAEARAVLANLPQALADARKPKRRPRPLVLAAAGVAMIAVGGVVFSIVRRSMQPDPSPRPPSVEVTPKP